MTPLKRERLKRGITTWALAQEVGVHSPTINRLENAKAQASPALAARLARFFGNAITRDQILFPEDYPQEAAQLAAVRVKRRSLKPSA